MGIPQVIKDFLASEKAVATGLLVIASTVFVLMGKISFPDWQLYTQNVLGIYVVGKTVQGTAALFAPERKAPAGPPAPTPPTPPPLPLEDK